MGGWGYFVILNLAYRIKFEQKKKHCQLFCPLFPEKRKKSQCKYTLTGPPAAVLPKSLKFFKAPHLDFSK